MHTTPIHMGAEAAATPRSAPSTSAIAHTGHAHDLHHQAGDAKDQADDQHRQRSHLEAALRSVLKRTGQRQHEHAQGNAAQQAEASTATGTIGVFQEAMVSIM